MSSPPVIDARASWSHLDLFLFAFFAINPVAIGLWIFSFAPVVGGNLFLAVLLSGGVVLLGALVYGWLAGSMPWVGGDYVWQTRLLHGPTAIVLTLAAWWFVVAALAPVYGNILVVEVLDPMLSLLDAHRAVRWLGGESGAFAASLVAITTAAVYVGVGMRGVAWLQRVLFVVGGAGVVTTLVLLVTHSRNDFKAAYNREVALPGVATNHFFDVLRDGHLNASLREIEPRATVLLVPAILLFCLWIGWAGPLVGEVRSRRAGSSTLALVSAGGLAIGTSLVFLLAIGKGMGWQWWNESNNLYWGTIYGTTPTTPLGAWPYPVMLTGWLVDSTAFQLALLAAVSAWWLGWTGTLFLSATRVLVAAGRDGVLPLWAGRMSSRSVPNAALALLVVPAVGLIALDAYWDDFPVYAAGGVVALAVASLGSALAAAGALRRQNRLAAAAALVFAALLVAAIAAWIADPVYGVRTTGSLVYLGLLFALAGGVYGLSRRARAGLRSE